MPSANPESFVPNRPAAAPGRRRRLLVLLAGLVALAAVLVLYWIFFDASQSRSPGPIPDPRLAYAGPFRNVHPSVRYISDQRCADCHADICTSYAKHPMGYSLLPIAKAKQPPDGAGHNTPFPALGSLFRVDRDGGQVRHRRMILDPKGAPAAELPWDVHYAVGSGRRGYSYLTERDGYLFQTPISWYSQEKNAWALSPGFGSSLLTGRPVLPDCLFCHANRANHVEGSVHRYRQPVFDGHAIGCQRCHGPGELHVAIRERDEPVADKMDYTIVNPRHLERPLREAVCEQCHVTGETRIPRRGRGLYDFRPGLPMEAFWSVFVRPPEADKQKAVSHVEQMYQSRCFQRSEGAKAAKAMGCISCHDPHRVVRGPERLTYYRQRCLTCHERKGCSESPDRRQAKQDSCFECHMPRYKTSDIPHTASTDHRILRSGGGGPDRAAPLGSVGALPVVSFYRDRKGADDIDEDRDLALALVKLAGAGAASARDIRHALRALETSLQRDPDDLPAAEARGYALGFEDRWAEALTTFRDVLAKASDRELALVGAASAAEALGRLDDARTDWGRAVAANPWSPEYRRRLVLLLVKREAWAEALPECDAWLRLDPMSSEARTTRVSCLLAAGTKHEARAEFARIEALAPPNLGELRIRFERKFK